MLLNQCNTFLLECSYSCKNYTSIITDRFLVTKYPLRHESFPFYVEFFIPLSPTILLPGLTMWITWRVSWTKQEILNLHEHHGPRPLFRLVLVAHLFIFLCCVFFCLSFFCVLCWMLPVYQLWPLSYGSWIYNYICNQCLSPLMLWVRISIKTRCTTLCDKVCQWLATGRWFSPGPSVSATNKADCQDIIEILLKVALNTIKTKQFLRVFPGGFL